MVNQLIIIFQIQNSRLKIRLGKLRLPERPTISTFPEPAIIINQNLDVTGPICASSSQLVSSPQKCSQHPIQSNLYVFRILLSLYIVAAVERLKTHDIRNPAISMLYSILIISLSGQYHVDGSGLNGDKLIGDNKLQIIEFF